MKKNVLQWRKHSFNEEITSEIENENANVPTGKQTPKRSHAFRERQILSLFSGVKEQGIYK